MWHTGTGKWNEEEKKIFPPGKNGKSEKDTTMSQGICLPEEREIESEM